MMIMIPSVPQSLDYSGVPHLGFTVRTRHTPCFASSIGKAIDYMRLDYMRLILSEYSYPTLFQLLKPCHTTVHYAINKQVQKESLEVDYTCTHTDDKTGTR